MGLKRIERQRALQFLYALEYGDRSYEDAVAQFQGANREWRKGWRGFAKELAEKTHQGRAEFDREIAEKLEHWVIERLGKTDLVCLRMALCELKNFPDIPKRVTLNEYIELARLFGAEDSPIFVNGVLDALAKDYDEKDRGGVRGVRKKTDTVEAKHEHGA